MYEGRGTGRTTRQIENLPPGAVFIWCGGATHYPKMLARKLGREDVEVFSISVLDEGGCSLRGRRLSGIEVDHAANLSGKQSATYDALRIYSSV